jgi:surface antigen
MKNKIITGFLALVLTAGLAAPAHAERDTIGLLAGALGGGVIGHQFGQGKGNTWATAIGAVAGAVAGQSIGRSLDRGEYAYANSYGGGRHAIEYDRGYHRGHYKHYRPAPVYYVPTYEQRVSTYVVQPAPTYIVDNSVSNDRYCREYNAAVTVGGRAQPSYGRACMQPDGSWEIVR